MKGTTTAQYQMPEITALRLSEQLPTYGDPDNAVELKRIAGNLAKQMCIRCEKPQSIGLCEACAEERKAAPFEDQLELFSEKHKDMVYVSGLVCKDCKSEFEYHIEEVVTLISKFGAVHLSDSCRACRKTRRDARVRESLTYRPFQRIREIEHLANRDDLKVRPEERAEALRAKKALRGGYKKHAKGNHPTRQNQVKGTSNMEAVETNTEGRRGNGVNANEELIVRRVVAELKTTAAELLAAREEALIAKIRADHAAYEAEKAKTWGERAKTVGAYSGLAAGVAGLGFGAYKAVKYFSA